MSFLFFVIREIVAREERILEPIKDTKKERSLKDTNKTNKSTIKQGTKKNTKLTTKKTKIEDLTLSSWRVALLFDLFPNLLKCRVFLYKFSSMKMEGIMVNKLESKTVARSLPAIYYRSSFESFCLSL